MKNINIKILKKLLEHSVKYKDIMNYTNLKNIAKSKKDFEDVLLLKALTFVDIDDNDIRLTENGLIYLKLR